MLDLSNNYLGDKGLQCLAAVLQNTDTITAVSLSNNNITNDMCDVLVQSLKEQQSVSSLDLSHNPISFLAGVYEAVRVG